MATSSSSLSLKAPSFEVVDCLDPGSKALSSTLLAKVVLDALGVSSMTLVVVRSMMIPRTRVSSITLANASA